MNDIQFGEGTFDDLYGHKIVELKENFIRTEIKITSNLHQPMGLVHGGLYSSMAEAAISYAAYFTQEGTWVGVNNNTDFLKSSKEGLLVCTASVRSTLIPEIPLLTGLPKANIGATSP